MSNINFEVAGHHHSTMVVSAIVSSLLKLFSSRSSTNNNVIELFHVSCFFSIAGLAMLSCLQIFFLHNSLCPTWQIFSSIARPQFNEFANVQGQMT